jgi:hypothetical protein
MIQTMLVAIASLVISGLASLTAVLASYYVEETESEFELKEVSSDLEISIVILLCYILTLLPARQT